MLMAVVLVGALAACNGDSEPPAPEATTSSTTTTPATTTTRAAAPRPTADLDSGNAAFISWSRTATFRGEAMTSLSRGDVLGHGETACRYLSTSPSLSKAVASVSHDSAASEAEAEALLRAAGEHLCPENMDVAAPPAETTTTTASAPTLEEQFEEAGAGPWAQYIRDVENVDGKVSVYTSLPESDYKWKAVGFSLCTAAIELYRPAENVVVFASGLEVMTVATGPEPMKMDCRDWPRD